MRSVKMMRKKGNWYIEKINADPFARWLITKTKKGPEGPFLVRV
jgi:hypothetical protein